LNRLWRRPIPGVQAFLPEYDDVVVSFDGADEKTRNYLFDLQPRFPCLSPTSISWCTGDMTSSRVRRQSVLCARNGVDARVLVSR